MAMVKIFFIAFFVSVFWKTSAASEGVLPECLSHDKKQIKHFDFEARPDGTGKRILILGGMHGDEDEAHQLALLWLKRLERIGRPSNHWRVIPIVNPDGFVARTRYNLMKVDINRNFPTQDWDQNALSYWRYRQKSDPRKFPGNRSGSEPETLCVMRHIEDFKPDLVVSIHTPYGQFDFDGPSGKKLKSKLLPWKQIGTFPGSLGRYLWDERRIPTLTIELRPGGLKRYQGEFLKLQDFLSDLI